MTIPSIDELMAQCRDAAAAIPAELLTPGRKIALYGAGFVGAWGVRWLRRNGIEAIAVGDRNEARHGSKFHGVEVVSAQDLAARTPDAVFISARHAVAPVTETLKTYGIRTAPLDAYVIATYRDALRNLHDNVLADTRSQETLRAVVSAMLAGTTAPLEAVFEPNQYFCLPRFAGAGQDIYIDAGAYVGDSVERFIWATEGAFAKIHAFEPSERQFRALQKRTERLEAEWALHRGQITLHRLALADGNAQLGMSTESAELQNMALTAEAGGNVETASLDALFDSEPVTFIKADVEGMELPLLEGAAHTIRRNRPKLAICVYHYPSDIPEITAYIQSLVPDYRFALRHHAPRLLETVLYCWMD